MGPEPGELKDDGTELLLDGWMVMAVFMTLLAGICLTGKTKVAANSRDRMANVKPKTPPTTVKTVAFDNAPIVLDVGSSIVGVVPAVESTDTQNLSSNEISSMNNSMFMESTEFPPPPIRMPTAAIPIGRPRRARMEPNQLEISVESSSRSRSQSRSNSLEEGALISPPPPRSSRPTRSRPMQLSVSRQQSSELLQPPKFIFNDISDSSNMNEDYNNLPGKVASRNPSPRSSAYSSTPPSPLTQKTTPRSSTYEGKLRWRKGEVLGTGSFGRVFKGLNQLTGGMMAVKQVSFEPGDSKAAEAIAAEVDIMKRLSHPNIVMYLGTETDTEDGTLYIFMEFVTGGSLLSIVEKFGLVEEPLARIYSQQALSGLQYLHESGIVHRDVKTANILVDDQGRCKLSDFGASKVMEGSVTINQKADAIHGTPVFMAPEAVLQRNQGRKSDLWSMGCTVLHMVSGKFPWSEKRFTNPAAAMFVIASTEEVPDWDRELLSPELTNFLICMFQRDPELRWSAPQLLGHEWIINGPSE